MPIDKPTLQQQIDAGAGEFEARLPGVLARLRTSVVGVINRVLAGAVNALYHYMDYQARQWWPDQCDDDNLPAHAARWGRPRLPAAAAAGTVRLTGATGAVVNVGTVLQRADGVQYATAAGAVVAASVVDVPVLALVPGQLGNAALATPLSLVSPVAGLNAVATALTALAGGADVETISAWRARILVRIRKPPQGGADFDYTAWAQQVPGVTRVWVYPQEQGAGTVVLRFVRDADASIIPDPGEVAAVQAAIDAQRPVTALAFVVAPLPLVQNFSIQLLPDTPAARSAVEAELRDLYRRAAKPGGTMLISQQREAVSIAAGEIDHVMTVPAANQAHATGQMPTVGTFTWL